MIRNISFVVIAVREESERKRVGITVNSFSGFFQNYIDFSGMPKEVDQGEILSMEIDRQRRALTLRLAFGALVERPALFELERRIRSSLLALNQVWILPSFPPESFSVDYFQDLVLEYMDHLTQTIRSRRIWI